MVNEKLPPLLAVATTAPSQGIAADLPPDPPIRSPRRLQQRPGAKGVGRCGGDEHHCCRRRYSNQSDKSDRMWFLHPNKTECRGRTRQDGRSEPIGYTLRSTPHARLPAHASHWRRRPGPRVPRRHGAAHQPGRAGLVMTFLVGTIVVGEAPGRCSRGFRWICLSCSRASLLFGVASNNGTVELHRRVGGASLQGPPALIPWMVFVVASLPAMGGALGSAGVALLAPIALRMAAAMTSTGG